MLTKKYKNGFVTLNAEMFLPITQETIDREIRNFEPVKTAIEKLHEYEQKDIPLKISLDEEYGLSRCPKCNAYIIDYNKYCAKCGQRLDWSSMI